MTHDQENPQYRVLAGYCSGGNCPTVYEDGDDLIVQGYVAEALFTEGYLPTGESAVRIPKSLLEQLA